MTSDAFAEAGGAPGAASSGARAPRVSELLEICDRVLGEPGRRQHRFSWLRAPDAVDDWLVVDAYYPASRVVVVCRSQSGPHDHLYRELVPGRGLRLLELSPAQMPGERAAAQAELRRLIADLGPAPPRAHEATLQEHSERDTPLAETAMARVLAALTPEPPAAGGQRRRPAPSQAAAVQRATRFVANRTSSARGRPRPASTASAELRTRARPAARPRPRQKPVLVPAGPPDSDELQPLWVLTGLALAAVVLAEVYFGVARAGLDRGQVTLAFGLALDGCARTLGSVAARRARRVAWSWLCLLGGSPFVAAFALFQRSGPVRVDPAPLAGLISLLALLVLLGSLLAAALGL